MELSIPTAVKTLFFATISAIFFAGCVPQSPDNVDLGPSGGGDDPTDFAALRGDFECLKNWPKVRAFRITNKRGKLDEALALANNPEPGKQYPVGTIIQLFPEEAMVKRKAGFDPDNNDWEYFQLDASRSGTEILVRGKTVAVNRQGDECLTCHADAREFDFICEEDNGCDPLPAVVNDTFINFLQNTDPRC